MKATGIVRRIDDLGRGVTVSYTHLEVYKRQVSERAKPMDMVFCVPCNMFCSDFYFSDQL